MMRHIPSSYSRYRFPETEDFKHLFNLHPLMSLIIESLKNKVSFFFSKSEILFILSTFLFSAVRVLFETSTLSSLLYISDYEDLPMFRSSHPDVFLGKCVLKIYSKFIGEHPCRSATSIKLLCNLIKHDV